MNRLREGLAPGAANGVYVLHGLGGCGKTAVACDLFEHASEMGRVALWVNASESASLRAGMLAVAADRGAADGELMGARSGLRPAADLVWKYLDNSDEPWLLVMDNADEPSILRDGGWLRSSPAGTVVVTTRQAAEHWWPGAELLRFGVLPREDAALVLSDLAPHAGSLEDAAAVADRLGRLPLALTLAGRFLAHQVIDPWSLTDYHLRLDGGSEIDPIDLIDQGAATDSDSNSRHLTSGTWLLSLDALAARGIPEARYLLSLLCCWTSDPLPLSLLSGAEPGPLPSLQLDAALRGLVDQSLAELVQREVPCLRTHSVLLDSVARAVPADQREELTATAARLLLAVLPEVPERGPQEPGVIMLAPHAIALLRRSVNWGLSQRNVEVVASCVLRVITAIHRSGDYASALALATEAVNLTTRQLSADNVVVLRIRQRVARALFRLGDFEKSEAMHRMVLEDFERVLGSDAADTLEGCLRLACPLSNLDQTQEAISLIQRAVAGRARLFGDLHPLTLIARMNLVEMAGAPDVAASTSSRQIAASGPKLVADCIRELGEDHVLTYDCKLNCAYLLSSTGKPEEALPYVVAALTGYEEKYGLDHPATLNARRTLSVVLGSLNRTEEAFEHTEALVEGRIQVLGSDHPWTVSDKELLEQLRKKLGTGR